MVNGVKRRLFVGGIADGKWMDVPDGADRYLIPVLPDLNYYKPPGPQDIPLSYDNQLYKKAILVDDEHYGKRAKYSVMFVDGGIGLIGHLVSGYKPDKEQG